MQTPFKFILGSKLQVLLLHIYLVPCLNFQLQFQWTFDIGKFCGERKNFNLVFICLPILKWMDESITSKDKNLKNLCEFENLKTYLTVFKN